MEKIVGLHIVFMFLMKALNLSQCSRPDTQISISVRMSVGNVLNKDISVGLSHFGCQCGVLVLWSIFTHIVFITKLRGVVVFQKFIIFLWRMGQNVFACWWYTHLENVAKVIWRAFLFACWWYTHVENVVKLIWWYFLARFYVLAHTVVSSYVVYYDRSE